MHRKLTLKQEAGQGLSEEDKKSMLEALREGFAETLVAENEQRNSEALAEKAGLVPIRQTLDASMARLQDELLALGRRGSFNLAIGAATTCLSVVLLTFMLFGHNETNASVPELLSYYIPRVSTVVFVEIFGFFFLRLYKSSLSERQYYQNELTTLSLFYVAVDMVARSSSPESFAALAKSLVERDRNRGCADGITPAQKNDALLEKLASIIQEVAKIIPQAGK